ncbi:MAG: bifunctional oligoribonuclease/PAP phosphatase NrnA [Clostridia bacterium]|nr:bifunctional oligoribonuclease/PAP phosphatase NrnA [Clostridia bacterium]
MNNTLKDIARFIEAHDGFGIIGHVSPDGDSFGSALGLHHALKAMGKKSVPLFADGMTKYCSFLPGADEVRTDASAEEYPFAIAVDCADHKRLGSVAEYFDKAEHRVCIDHHVTNVGYADMNYVETVAATGELIYRLLGEMDFTPDRNTAACLYTAIATDTGNFSFNNTTSNSFRITSELVGCGIALPEINRRLFSEKSLGHIRLQGRIIEKMHMSDDCRVSVSTVSCDDIRSLGATLEDAENLIDTLRVIDTVEAAAVLKEIGDGSIRVSMRGKVSADVSSVATRFGGGGHKLAAGCTLYTDLDEAATIIFNALCECVKEY